MSLRNFFRSLGFTGTKTHQNYWAVVAIQKRWRGYKRRRKLWSYGGAFYIYNVLKVQCAIRQYLARKRAKVLWLKKVDIAVHKIHSLFYFWKSRRLRLIVRCSFMKKCIIKLQCGFRRRKAKKLFLKLKEIRRNKMATRIQSIIRRFLGYCHVQRRRNLKDLLMHEFATTGKKRPRELQFNNDYSFEEIMDTLVHVLYSMSVESQFYGAYNKTKTLLAWYQRYYWKMMKDKKAIAVAAAEEKLGKLSRRNSAASLASMKSMNSLASIDSFAMMMEPGSESFRLLTLTASFVGKLSSWTKYDRTRQIHYSLLEQSLGMIACHTAIMNKTSDHSKSNPGGFWGDGSNSKLPWTREHFLWNGYSIDEIMDILFILSSWQSYSFNKLFDAIMYKVDMLLFYCAFLIAPTVLAPDTVNITHMLNTQFRCVANQDQPESQQQQQQQPQSHVEEHVVEESLPTEAHQEEQEDQSGEENHDDDEQQPEGLELERQDTAMSALTSSFSFDEGGAPTTQPHSNERAIVLDKGLRTVSWDLNEDRPSAPAVQQVPEQVEASASPTAVMITQEQVKPPQNVSKTTLKILDMLRKGAAAAAEEDAAKAVATANLPLMETEEMKEKQKPPEPDIVDHYGIPYYLSIASNNAVIRFKELSDLHQCILRIWKLLNRAKQLALPGSLDSYELANRYEFISSLQPQTWKELYVLRDVNKEFMIHMPTGNNPPVAKLLRQDTHRGGGGGSLSSSVDATTVPIKVRVRFKLVLSGPLLYIVGEIPQPVPETPQGATSTITPSQSGKRQKKQGANSQASAYATFYQNNVNAFFEKFPCFPWPITPLILFPHEVNFVALQHKLVSINPNSSQTYKNLSRRLSSNQWLDFERLIEFLSEKLEIVTSAELASNFPVNVMAANTVPQAIYYNNVESFLSYTLPEIHLRRLGLLQSNQKRYVTILIQRIYRGYKGRQRYVSIKSKKVEIQRRRYLSYKVYYKLVEMRARHERMAIRIQALVKGWLWRCHLYQMNVAAIVIQCRARMMIARMKAEEERRRQLHGAQVMEMLPYSGKTIQLDRCLPLYPPTFYATKSTKTITSLPPLVSSPLTFQLRIFRCGNNYRFEGFNAISGINYEGQIYQIQLKQLLQLYNEDILKKTELEANQASQYSYSTVILKQLQVQLWQYEKVCQFFMKYIDLIPRIYGVTNTLGGSKYDTDLELVIVYPPLLRLNKQSLHNTMKHSTTGTFLPSLTSKTVPIVRVHNIENTLRNTKSSGSGLGGYSAGTKQPGEEESSLEFQDLNITTGILPRLQQPFRKEIYDHPVVMMIQKETQQIVEDAKRYGRRTNSAHRKVKSSIKDFNSQQQKKKKKKV